VIEALVIGSAVFIIVIAAVTAVVRITVIGSEAAEAARTAAVHAARHDDVASAAEVARSLFPSHDVIAVRRDDSIAVETRVPVRLAHPDGSRTLVVEASAEMPLAPFRSDRG
jgi:hypothetical protein